MQLPIVYNKMNVNFIVINIINKKIPISREQFAMHW